MSDVIVKSVADYVVLAKRLYSNFFCFGSCFVFLFFSNKAVCR